MTTGQPELLPLAERYAASRCRIDAVGMINVLGSGTQDVFARVTAGDTSRFTRQTDLVENAEVLVGAVRETLPDVPERLARYRFRNCGLLLAAFQQIKQEVAAVVERYGAERIAVITGSSTAGIMVNEEAVALAVRDGAPAGARAHLYQEMASASEFLVEYAGLRGPCYTLSTACSSSSKVFAVAKRLLALGLCDAVVAGGADTISKLTLSGFAALQLLSPEVSNPFSKNRSGIVIGEGGALCLLTRETGGIQLLGCGESCDAFHFSAPDPSGEGAESAMRNALHDAGIAPGDVCYVNLHGTGTPPNDKMEAQAVARVFPRTVYASSTKPLTGHLLGASGATELGICAAALASTGPLQLPPHLWDGAQDPELPELALVGRGSSITRPEIPIMLSNSFAFGGSNAALIIAGGPRQ